MGDSITPEEFVEELSKHCRLYTEEVQKTLENGLKKIGRETAAEVKSLSPVYEGNSKRLEKGKYQKGWTSKFEKTGHGSIKVTVHNKKYQLVHLLELGHLLKDGTCRVYGEVLPKTHVETAEQHAKEKVNALLEGL